MLLLLLPASMPMGAAATGPQAGADVESTFVLSQPSWGTIDVFGVLLVHAYDVDGRTLAARDLAASPLAIARMQEAASDEVAVALRAAHPGAEIAMGTPAVDPASLEAARVDAGPIRMTLGALVEPPRDALGIGTLRAHDLDAALAAGARWTLDLPLAAPAGQRATYVVRAPAHPPGLAVLATSEGTIGAAGREATIGPDDAGTGPRVVTLVMGRPDAPLDASSALEQQVDLRLGAIERGAAGVPFRASIRLEAYALDLRAAADDALPPGLALGVTTAQGVRDLARAGLLGANELALIEQELVARLAEAFPDARVEGALDPASLVLEDASAPIVLLAAAEGVHPLPAGAGDADVALAIGAALGFDLQVAAAAADTTLVIHAPERTVFVDADGPRATTASTRTFRLAPGEALPATRLTIRDPGAATLASDRATLDVGLDIHSIEVSASGSTKAQLVGDVNVTLRILVLSVPDDVRARLGDEIELTHVGSDGVRLLLARGLLDERQLLDAVEERLRAPVERALGGPLVGAAFEAHALDASAGSGPGEPLTFVLRGSFERPLVGGAEPTHGSIALYTRSQGFQFPGSAPADASYIVLLPRGLDLARLDVDAGESSAWRVGDRAGFTVRPGPEGSAAVATLVVSPSFLLAHFPAATFAAALVLALAAGAPFAIARARRRAAG